MRKQSAKDMLKNKKILKTVFLVLLFGVAVGIGLVLGGFRNKSAKGKTPIAGEVIRYAEDQNYDVEDADSISIPGYDTFHFAAGQTCQEVTLHNPIGNTCYFKMFLVLEDGTVIWESDLLEPGMAYTRIELTQKLEKGTYPNVRLKYDCYSLKNRNQLNGAEIKVSVIVK